MTNRTNSIDECKRTMAAVADSTALEIEWAKVRTVRLLKSSIMSQDTGSAAERTERALLRTLIVLADVVRTE